MSNLEKQKSRLQGEIEDLLIEVERSQSIAANSEKQQRSFDKTIDEWKAKVADVQAELERANADGRATAADVYKLKSQIDETHETIEALRRENKNLSGRGERIVIVRSGALLFLAFVPNKVTYALYTSSKFRHSLFVRVYPVL